MKSTVGSLFIRTPQGLLRKSSLGIDKWSPSTPKITPSRFSSGFQQCLQTRYSMTQVTRNDSGDFFRYTSGRWLWDEERQLQDRYRAFSIQELKAVAAKSLGANECISMVKLGEGNFNKAFRLIMDNGTIAIARIPHPNAGPPTYTTASEVATMDFARTVLNIPVPIVLAWAATTENPVGSEHILMTEAEGTQLTQVWGEMGLENKRNVVEDIVSIEKKLVSVSFSRLGAIYYAKDRLQGCEKAEVTSDVPLAVKRDIESRFVIGPTVEREFWEKEKGRMDIDRGPWRSATHYVESIAHREIAWIKRFAEPKVAGGPTQASAAQRTPGAHLDLLEKYLLVVSSLLPDDPVLLSSRLWHRDIHDGNLFVNGDRITSVIDWQSADAGPMVVRARAPRLLDFQGEIKLKLPENFEELDEIEKDRLRHQVSMSILTYIYESETAKQNPILSRVLCFPHGKTLKELVTMAGNTWDDDILPLRECLIRVERDWKEIGKVVPCPFHFSEDEIRQHREDGKGFNEAQDFWDSLEGKVDRTGWVANEDFDDAVEYFHSLRETGLNTLAGAEQEEFEEQTRWILKHRVRAT